MTTDLGLIVDAAERQPHELAAERARDRLTQAGLANAGRADEAQDRRAQALRALADRHVFQDAFLDFLHAVMVLVEHGGGGLDVPGLFRRRSPGQGDQPIDVGPDDADLGRGRRNALHPVDLLQGTFLDALRHPRGFDLLAQRMQLGAFFVLAELFANRLQLLAQDLIALELADGALHLVLNLGLELEDLDLLAQKQRQQPEALDDVGRLQQVLLLLERLVGAAETRSAR